MALLRWLAGQGIDVAGPVRSDAGNDVETVETAAGSFHAVVFEAAAGHHPDLDDLTPPQLREWGETAGRLHAAFGLCPQELAGQRPLLRDRLDRVGQAVPAEFVAIRREADQLAKDLDGLAAGSTEFGLVHLDLELDNMLWDERGITVIDFDDCARGWYPADVAFALRDAFDEGAGLTDQRVRAFVDGYRRHHALDEDALARVPLFSRLATMLNLGALTFEVDRAVELGQADWLNDLIGYLRGEIASYEGALAVGEDMPVTP